MMLDANVIAETGLAESQLATVRARKRRVLEQVEAVQPASIVELLVFAGQYTLHWMCAQMCVSVGR